jgi:hypothetical protein
MPMSPSGNHEGRTALSDGESAEWRGYRLLPETVRFQP